MEQGSLVDYLCGDPEGAPSSWNRWGENWENNAFLAPKIVIWFKPGQSDGIYKSRFVIILQKKRIFKWKLIYFKFGRQVVPY